MVLLSQRLVSILVIFGLLLQMSRNLRFRIRKLQLDGLMVLHLLLVSNSMLMVMLYYLLVLSVLFNLSSVLLRLMMYLLLILHLLELPSIMYLLEFHLLFKPMLLRLVIVLVAKVALLLAQLLFHKSQLMVALMLVLSLMLMAIVFDSYARCRNSWFL